jgi:hypothetical protein
MPPSKPERFGPIEVQGRQLRCAVCSHGVFWEHEIQLATPLLNLLVPMREWHNAVRICERCGHVHMFIPPPSAIRILKRRPMTRHRSCLTTLDGSSSAAHWYPGSGRDSAAFVRAP